MIFDLVQRVSLLCSPLIEDSIHYVETWRDEYELDNLDSFSIYLVLNTNELIHVYTFRYVNVSVQVVW